MKQYIFYLICILICLVTIGSIAAEDINNTDDIICADDNLNNVNVDVLTINDTNEDKTLKDFKSMLYTNNNITLEYDYSYNKSSDAIWYTDSFNIKNKNLTINGDNHYINFKKNATLFNIVDSNVVLKDITFIDGRDNYKPGGLFKVSNSNLTIINCSFEKCYSYKEGGVLYAKDSVVNIIRSSFNNCNSSMGSTSGGGAIYVDDSSLNIFESNFTNCNCFKTSSGGAVSAYESFTILKDCIFKNNKANSGSGAVCIEESGEVYNCIFLNNIAVNNGGALSILLNGKIVNCNFTDNIASGKGGALYLGKCNIINSNFINNTASDNGGAVHLVDGNITGCNFTGNLGVDGSSIYCLTPMTLNITDSNFIRNIASGKGAVNSVDSVINCIFIGNYANYGAGVYFNHRDDFILQNTIKDSIFINNTARNKGGAVYCERVNLTVINSKFINNTAYYGGAFYVKTDLLLFNNLTFENNTGKMKGNILYGTVGNGSIINSTINKHDSKDISVSGNSSNLILLTPDELKEQNENNINNNVNNTVVVNDDKQIRTDTPINQITKKNTLIVKTTPKLIVKKATFKVKIKTKKYTVTLKNNKNKPIKNVKITLKIKGKTYTSKTNKNGKATFKITKLKKKGTFKATILFKGNKNYKKISKTVKIKCK